MMVWDCVVIVLIYSQEPKYVRAWKARLRGLCAGCDACSRSGDRELQVPGCARVVMA